MTTGGESRDRVLGRDWIESVLPGGAWVGRASFTGASGAGIDTRRLRPGEIFVALRTETGDGHDFLAEAANRGAAGALVSEPAEALALPQLVVPDPAAALQALGLAWRRLWPGRLYAITGSCGKTSTRECLAHLLGSERTFASPDNFNNLFGVPLSLLGLRAHHTHAVLEAGINQRGEMARLAALLEPDAALVTTIEAVHLEGLGSLEGVAGQKAILPAAVGPGGARYLGPACARYRAFRELDGPDTRWLRPAGEGAGSEAASASVGPAWHFGVDPGEGGDGLTILGPAGESWEGTLPPVPEAMAANAALAVLVAREAGVPDELLRERLRTWRSAGHRGERVTRGGWTVYADCYNSNPAALREAARFFVRSFPEGPRWWVVGSMVELGEESARWHREAAGFLPVAPGDRVLLVGGEARPMEEVLRDRLGPEAVRWLAEAEEVPAHLPTAGGILFLKGSRIHRLEKVLDSLAGEG